MELFILIMFRIVVIIILMFKKEKYTNNQLEQNQIIFDVICVFHSFPCLESFICIQYLYMLCIHYVYLALEFKI